MIYKVINTTEADDGLARLAKNEPKAFAKSQCFIEEEDTPKDRNGASGATEGASRGSLE